MIYMDFTSWVIVTVLSFLVALIWWFIICRYTSIFAFMQPDVTQVTKACQCPRSIWCTWVIAWLGAWLGTPVMGRWGPMSGSIAIIPAVIGSFFIIVFFCCLCWCFGKRDQIGSKNA